MFSGRPQSDIIVIYHSWARVDPLTASGEVSHPLWTESDLLTLPRSAIVSLVWSPEAPKGPNEP